MLRAPAFFRFRQDVATQSGGEGSVEGRRLVAEGAPHGPIQKNVVRE